MADTGVIALTLDLRGLKCPLPVLRTRKKLAELPAGSTIARAAIAPVPARHSKSFISRFPPAVSLH